MVKFAWPRRQEEDRRRRWWPKTRSFEAQDRTIDKNQFIRRRRRDAEIECRKVGRRFDLRAKLSEPTARVPGVRTARIAAQIRPKGRRRIRDHAMAPDNLFAPDRQHRGDTRRIGAARKKRKKFLVAVDGVERERCGIGVGGVAIVAHRPAANLGDRRRIGRRRRAGGQFSHEKRAVESGRVPRDLGALCQIADAKAYAREDVVEAQSADRDHFRERAGKGAVRPGLVRRHRARSGIESDRHARSRIDQR